MFGVEPAKKPEQKPAKEPATSTPDADTEAADDEPEQEQTEEPIQDPYAKPGMPSFGGPPKGFGFASGPVQDAFMAGWNGYQEDEESGEGGAANGNNTDGPVKGGWGGGFAGFHDLASGYPGDPGALGQSQDAAEGANADGEIDAHIIDENVSATVAPPEGIVSLDGVEV